MHKHTYENSRRCEETNRPGHSPTHLPTQHIAHGGAVLCMLHMYKHSHSGSKHIKCPLRGTSAYTCLQLTQANRKKKQEVGSVGTPHTHWSSPRHLRFALPPIRPPPRASAMSKCKRWLDKTTSWRLFSCTLRSVPNLQNSPLAFFRFTCFQPGRPPYSSRVISRALCGGSQTHHQHKAGSVPS